MSKTIEDYETEAVDQQHLVLPLRHDRDGLAELKRELADAVREYEVALMRNPMDEEEIRRAVDKCVNARKQFNAANTEESNV